MEGKKEAVAALSWSQDRKPTGYDGKRWEMKED